MAEDGYYGYVEGEAANQINWGEIGKNMSDMLVTQKRVREEKRVAIDDASRELGEELANAPTGTYDAGNEFVLGYAENAQQYRMMADKLLKSGQLKLKDYMVGRANINSDTDTMFSLAQEYQTEFAEKMKRYDNDESAFLEVWEMEQVEGMANLNGVKATPNPTNGIVTLLNKDGSTMTVNGMRSRLKNRYDRFDIDGETQNIADSLGIDVRMLGKDKAKWEKGVGVWLTTADPKQKVEYKAMENDKIQSVLTNPYNTASVLIDHGAEGKYTFINKASITDGYKAKANEIVIDYTQPMSERVTLTPKQEEEAAEVIRRQIRTKIDTKITAQFKNEQYSPERRAMANVTAAGSGDKKQETKDVSLWMEMYGADTDEKNLLLSSLIASPLSLKRGLRSAIFVEGDDGLIRMNVTYKDSTLNRTGKNGILVKDNPTQDEWARLGSEIHGSADPTTIMKDAGGYGDSKYNNEYSGVGSSRDDVTVEKSDIVTVHDYIDSNADAILSTDMFFDKNNADVLPTIDAAIGKFGGSVEKSDSFAGNGFTILASDGKKSVTYNTNLGSAADAKKQRDDILDFLKNHMTIEAAERSNETLVKSTGKYD